MKFLAFGVTAALIVVSCSSSRQQPDGVYVSVVRKKSVSTFNNRLSGNDYHLVVTNEPVYTAIATSFLNADDQHELWIAELEGVDSSTTLAGEVLRMRDFAVLRLPAGQDPHQVLGSHNIYTEKLNSSSRSFPPAGLSPGRSALLNQGADASVGDPARLLADTIPADQDWLREKLAEFSGAEPVILNGRSERITERRTTAGRALARAWLRLQYEELGYQVTDLSYNAGLTQGVNLTAERTGQDPEKVLIISAHYDSVGNAGADDDGSGTVSALAIAKALADLPLKYNLRILAFDQEENGLLGSTAYARHLNDSGKLATLTGVINIEMTGYDADDDGAFHAIHCNENSSATLAAYVNQVVVRDPLRLRVVNACTNRSDHAAFWRYNVPAIVVSENFFGGDSNPCYHQSCDRIDQINFDYMGRLTTALIRSVAEIVVQ